MNFTVAVQQTPEGIWVGQVVELPAVADQADTREQLLENLKEGILFYWDSMRADFLGEPGAEMLSLSLA